MQYWVINVEGNRLHPSASTCDGAKFRFFRRIFLEKTESFFYGCYILIFIATTRYVTDNKAFWPTNPMELDPTGMFLIIRKSGFRDHRNETKSRILIVPVILWLDSIVSRPILCGYIVC